MSNELSVFEGKLPDYLKTVELDETTKALAGGESSFKRISIRGGVFRMVVGGKEVATNEDRAMNIVIVKAAPNISRQYYAKAWDPDAEPETPTCWSTDGKTPDPAVENPQSSHCATCPQNVAGSGQGTSRACRYQQRLAVVLEGDMGGDVYQLVLPATSIFGDSKGAKMPLQAYGRYLAGHGVPVTAVVTEMRFDTSVESPKLTFRPVRPLTEEEYLRGKEQSETPDAQTAITMTVRHRDVKSQSSAPVETTAEEPAAPTVRPAKAKAAAAPAGTTIKAALAAWDSDDE